MKTLFMKELVLGALLLFGSRTAVCAQGYTITRSVIAGGGNTGTNRNGYSISSTVGQLGAGGGATNVAGGEYSITGGFWASGGTQAGTSLTNGCQVFNTGMGGPHGNIALAPGTMDPNFILVSEPPGAGTTAVVSSPLAPNWIANSAGSQWISPEEDSSNSPAGAYHYRLQFYLTCANSQLTGVMAADDTAGLFLNGQPEYFIPGWTMLYDVNLTSGFVSGLNTLDIYVTNSGYWTGLRAQLTNCFSCPDKCLSIDGPTGVVVTNCGPDGVALGDFSPFSVEITDNCCNSNSVVISYSPPVVYPGTTTVTATATDACSNTAECSFPVTVVGLTNPPTIECPSNIVVSTGCSSLQVYYDVQAGSAYCSNADLSVNPPSGSFFPVGTNVVTSIATDCCGNTNYCSFLVIVNQAEACVAGETWIKQTNDDTVGWQSLASSADGSRLVAAVPYVAGGTGGLIYTSTDYGVTWTAQNSGNHVWSSIASSSDGRKLVAAVFAGQIYTSTDYGTNWTARNSGTQYWQSVASSSDGSRLVAVVNGFSPGGLIYTSADSGTNWTAQDSGTELWVSVASSSDGSRLVASDANTGQVFTSTDYGTNWTSRIISGAGSYVGSVVSSSDGSKLAVTATVEATGYTGIFTSVDYGTNWTAQNVGINSSPFLTVASSSDGSKLVMVAEGGQIYISANSGTNWTAHASVQDWQRVVSSSDGTKLAALVSAGAIYTSDCTPVECCVPPPTNMVLWLPFDETSGPISANLASPEDYGTQINNPTHLLGSYVANSLQFNGANYVTVPDYTNIEIGTNNLTIDAWIYDTVTNIYETNVIVDKRNPVTGAGYSLWLTPATGLIFGTSGGYRFGVGTSISTQAWHFVAVTLSQGAGSSEASFYVDGVLTGTFSPAAVNLSNTNALWVGAGPANPFGSAPSWVGALDEVEIYNRALSTNELFGIYSAGTAGKCKPCCYLKVLTISRLPGNLSPPMIEINWGGCGILQESTNVLGPWTPIQNAASPYTTPATGTEMFYKLDCP